jgi:SPP1 gp7 family putative phage head morphogenesis protein
MKRQTVIKLLQTIEGFFKQSRYNVALETILRSEEYRKFRNELYSSLSKQIDKISSIQTINTIVGVFKADEIPYKEIRSNLDSVWLPLTTILAIEDYESYLKYVAQTAGEFAYRDVGLDGEFEISKKLLRAIKKQQKTTLESVEDTTKEWMAKVIYQSVNIGQSHYDISKNLRSGLEKIVQYRSDVIAEQEAAMLLGMITLSAFEEKGIMMKRLITSRDELVCPICTADEAAGSISLEDEFPSGNKTTPIHIGCRCFIVPG